MCLLSTGCWRKYRQSRHNLFLLRIYSLVNNFMRLPGITCTIPQSFEFEDYYCYYFQLPFSEHPLGCRYYLRWGSLEVSSALENAWSVLLRDMLEAEREPELGERVGYATTSECPFRRISKRRKGGSQGMPVSALKRGTVVPRGTHPGIPGSLNVFCLPCLQMSNLDAWFLIHAF